MKKMYLTTLIMFLSLSVLAQAPEAFNYQAILRSNSGYLLYNTAVNFKISIVQDSIGGHVTYSEIHSTTTNIYGGVNLAIGQGTVLTGAFDSIPWTENDHFMKIQVDTTDGSNYYDMGTTQILSVPYALESRHASSLTLTGEDGKQYEITVDTLGNIIATAIEGPWMCGDSLPDPGNNKKYATVMIGTQCWFAQNINLGTRIDGTLEQTDDGFIEKYCYNDSESNCDIYGGHYQWDEAMQYITTEGAQGICPSGWHIPTDGECFVLANFLGGSDIAGGKMKTKGTIEAGTGLWYDPNEGATNESGFNGLPGGYRDYTTGSFFDLGVSGHIWTSTENGDLAWHRDFLYYNTEWYRNADYKVYGNPIRCLKDDL